MRDGARLEMEQGQDRALLADGGLQGFLSGDVSDGARLEMESDETEQD